MRQLHPVFNVVKLSAAPEDPILGRKLQAPPPPIVVDGEEEWEVEEILDSRWHRRRFQFLVKWKSVTNFIWPYLHQSFDDSHGLKTSLKPLRRPFDRYQSRLEEINIGQDIRQINW